LVTGCSVGMSSQSGVEPLPVPSSIPSPLPTQTMTLRTEVAPVNEVPEIPVGQTPSSVPLPAEHRPPPARDDLSLPTPVEMARFDLADRLHTDVTRVQVMGVVTREPDAEVMLCLGDNTLFKRLWEDLVDVQVQWISLSVKGNVHHYAALGGLVIYCER
jgi:hypothetical protein